jgi:hypothetical protein
MQWSGAHLHVDIGSQDSSLHIFKLHGLDLDSHEHDTEFDVELFETSSSWYKLVKLFILAAITIFTANLFVQLNSRPPYKQPSYRQLDYWRPILRAPPKFH